MISFKELTEHPLLVGLESEMNKALVKQLEFSFGVKCYELIDNEHEFSLLTLRKSVKLTQQKVSKYADIAQSVISKVEFGRRIPPKDAMNRMLDVYRVDRKKYAEYMEQKIRNGSLVIPPVYALAHKNFIWETEEDKELVWELTKIQWNNQAGIPLSFKAARNALCIQKMAYAKTTEFNHRQQMKLENYKVREIDAQAIIYVAIAYRISPLSLINGILLSTLDYSNSVLGGQVKTFIGKDKFGKPKFHYSPNEEFFGQLKDLIISLGLIPEWQIPMFDSYMLSTLGMFTREATGVNQFLPFPLTPKNYRAWQNDPILSLYQPIEPPESDFWYELGTRLPHDDLKVKDELVFYSYMINPPKIEWLEKILSPRG